MKVFFVRWVCNVIALLIAAFFLPGVWFKGWHDAILASLVLGFLNAFVRPVLLFLTLPLNIVSLGLFTVFLNAAIFFSVGYIIPGFMISGYGSSILGSILFSAVSTLLSWLLHERREINVGFHLWRY